MCGTALGLTTQSKLTVQAPALGSGVPVQSAVPGAWTAAHILVRCPVSGVGSLNGSLLGCLRKDVALCDTASRAWVGGRNVRETAHFMCTVLSFSCGKPRGRFVCHEWVCLNLVNFLSEMILDKAIIEW